MLQAELAVVVGGLVRQDPDELAEGLLGLDVLAPRARDDGHDVHAGVGLGVAAPVVPVFAHPALAVLRGSFATTASAATAQHP